MVGDTFSPMDAPGATGKATAQGITSPERLLKVYFDSTGMMHGYELHPNGTFTIINGPAQGLLLD